MSDPSDIDESNEEVCGPFLWTIQTTSPTISEVAQEKKVRLIHRCMAFYKDNQGEDVSMVLHKSVLLTFHSGKGHRSNNGVHVLSNPT